jgi:dTDP-4-dehydrorhamnose reductase
MRILILGATGMLGQDLLAAFSRHDVTSAGSRDADLSNALQVSQLMQRTRPEWTVLAAAYTNVDGCETDPAKAFSVNRDGAVHVAESAHQIGSRLLFVSTDYVFDGTHRTPYEIDALRNPINIYGRSKAEAEKRLLEILTDCCIVRTSWLFGKGGKCFPDTMLNLAKTKPVISVVDDQQGCPTYTSDLAQAIVQLVEKQARGIVHVTNRGNCSWYVFAKATLAAASPNTMIQPVTTAEFPRQAQRPAYSVLSDASLQTYGIKLPTWQDALHRYLAARNS